jgi:hypothetical protein
MKNLIAAIAVVGSMLVCGVVAANPPYHAPPPSYHYPHSSWSFSWGYPYPYYNPYYAPPGYYYRPYPYYNPYYPYYAPPGYYRPGVQIQVR